MIPARLPKVLVVDDTPANVLLLARMLTERGYEPQAVRSGAEALRLARAEPPDLILLDVSMPEMNGYEVCARLKAEPALRDIPVIFISALSDTMDKVKAFRVGGVDYVTKPFQLEEVCARIRTHLRLYQLEKLRDDLAHMMVHDLRNPLTVLFGFLDYLEHYECQRLSPATQALTKAARGSAADLLNMVNSILDVSKMGAGEMTLHCERCDLGALIRGVLAANQPLPDGRTVNITAPQSPPCVDADPGLLRRVVQNLLSNALRYAPAGSEVSLVVSEEADRVLVAVSDRGRGIAPAHHQRIFEKFGQVEDPAHRVGTGLGLTFCKLAVEAHGGQIGLTSAEGKGSTFWFTLPRAAVVNASPALSEAPCRCAPSEALPAR
jgi:two-component system sensor histidine kinase/response regulator